MTEKDRQDHIAMLRKRAMLPFRMNVILDVLGGTEWSLVKASTSMLAVAVVVVVFGGVTLFSTWSMGIGPAIVSAAAVVGIVARITVQSSKGPDQEMVLIFDEAREILEAPLAGLEIDATAVTKFAVREVSWNRRSSSIRDPLDVRAASESQDGARIWLCVYAFVEDQPHLLFAECSNHAATSGLRSAVRSFAECLGKPLMEPEPNHGPTVFE